MLKEINFSIDQKQKIIDITKEVRKAVSESGIKEGSCIVYTPHATCSVIINENWDPNVGEDIIAALNKLFPRDIWKHDKVDHNGAAHIKSAILGPSETVLIKEGELLLGQWQNLMFCDFDGPKQRRAFVKINGD